MTMPMAMIYQPQHKTNPLFASTHSPTERGYLQRVIILPSRDTLRTSRGNLGAVTGHLRPMTGAGLASIRGAVPTVRTEQGQHVPRWIISGNDADVLADGRSSRLMVGTRG